MSCPKICNRLIAGTIFFFSVYKYGAKQLNLLALVSPLLLDDSVEDAEANCLSDSQDTIAEDEQTDLEVELLRIVLTTVLKILIQLEPTEFIQIMAGRCGDVVLHMANNLFA
ncbi:hypothetical protein CQW23_18834 [Capsicum baccatum]|uniref:Uncharacterized protein n=1 Tax=Capsicum baccatum TaxID=33114 RepID=A0A2G2W423_CAPBA|nr:hypothetical protein CQW23_18834 [Capsicum baccatum]